MWFFNFNWWILLVDISFKLLSVPMIPLSPNFLIVAPSSGWRVNYRCQQILSWMNRASLSHHGWPWLGLVVVGSLVLGLPVTQAVSQLSVTTVPITLHRMGPTNQRCIKTASSADIYRNRQGCRVGEVSYRQL